jgi:hypothetical protein
MKPLGLRISVWFLVGFRILAAAFAVAGRIFWWEDDSVVDALRWQFGYDWFANVVGLEGDFEFKMYSLFDFLSLYAAIVALVFSLIPYRGQSTPVVYSSDPIEPATSIPPGIDD